MLSQFVIRFLLVRYFCFCNAYFPITCDVIEFYLGNADTLYALLGLILQLIAQHVPESSEDCLRVFALLLQVIEKHPENGQMTRQCALGFLLCCAKVSHSY